MATARRARVVRIVRFRLSSRRSSAHGARAGPADQGADAHGQPHQALLRLVGMAVGEPAPKETGELGWSASGLAGSSDAPAPAG